MVSEKQNYEVEEETPKKNKYVIMFYPNPQYINNTEAYSTKIIKATEK